MRTMRLLIRSYGRVGRQAVFWLSFTCCGLMTLGAAAEPRLGCAAPDFDFGTATDAQTVTNIFLLRNSGTGTATITRVHSTCGCTTFLPTRPAVPPGETEPLTVLFNLKGRHGVQRRPVYVSWNSADGLPLRLMVSGVSVALIEVEPTGAFFPDAPLRGALERAVRIYDPSSNRLFRITGVACSDPRFTARVETDVEGRDYRLVVASAGPREAGPVSAAVTVQTDHPERPVLQVPIYLRAQETNERPAPVDSRDVATKVSK